MRRCARFQAETPAEQYAVVSLWLHLLDGRAALAAGRHDEASDAMLRAAEIATLGGRIEPCLVPWAGVALEAHLAAGRVGRAARCSRISSALRRAPEPLAARGDRARPCRARRARGPQRAGDRALRRGDRALAALPQPLEHAQALIRFGTYLRRNGRPRDAREPLAPRSRSASGRAPSGSRASPAPSSPRAAAGAAGGRGQLGAHRPGDARRVARRRGPRQRGDRCGAAPLPQDRVVSPPARLREARHSLAPRPDPPRRGVLAGAVAAKAHDEGPVDFWVFARC